MENINPMLDWIAMRDELDKFWQRLNAEFTGSGGLYFDYG